MKLAPATPTMKDCTLKQLRHNQLALADLERSVCRFCCNSTGGGRRMVCAAAVAQRSSGRTLQ